MLRDNDPWPCPICKAPEIALRQAEKYGLTAGNFAHMRLDTYEPDPKQISQTKALNAARKRVEHWRAGNSWRGLIFVSNTCGVGKTHLAVGMLWEAALLGMSIAVFDMPNYFDDLLDAFDKRNGEASVLRQTAVDVDCLLLDDVGKEKRKSDMVERVYFGILNARLNAHRTTLFTSNHTLDEMDGFLGAASASRICEMTGNIALVIDGDDYRRKKG